MWIYCLIHLVCSCFVFLNKQQIWAGKRFRNKMQLERQIKLFICFFYSSKEFQAELLGCKNNKATVAFWSRCFFISSWLRWRLGCRLAPWLAVTSDAAAGPRCLWSAAQWRSNSRKNSRVASLHLIVCSQFFGPFTLTWCQTVSHNTDRCCATTVQSAVALTQN